MQAQSASQQLAALLQAHGLESVTHGEWVAPNSRLPAIRATWYPRSEQSGQLDVEVLLEDERQLLESFGGIGNGQDGIDNALVNFCENSLHVLLSALWGKTAEDQVLVETWTVGERRFEAHIGNFGRRGAGGIAPALPADLFPTLEATVRAQSLDARLHWFRHFFCAFDHQRTLEALCDNDPWQAGVDALAGLAWVDSQPYYSVRHFLMLKPLN